MNYQTVKTPDGFEVIPSPSMWRIWWAWYPVKAINGEWHWMVYVLRYKHFRTEHRRYVTLYKAWG